MLADVQSPGLRCSVVAGSILQDRRESSDAGSRGNATSGIPGGVCGDRGATERKRFADQFGCMDHEDAVRKIGYAPEWIATKLEPRTVLDRVVRRVKSMTAMRENGWGVMKIMAQVVLGFVLTCLAGSAAYMAKSLSNHESRLSVVEEWKKDQSIHIAQIASDLAEIKSRNARSEEQARSTDMLVRDVSAQMRVITDTMIRMQEGQAAIREKMVSIQVATDEIKGAQ